MASLCKDNVTNRKKLNLLSIMKSTSLSRNFYLSQRDIKKRYCGESVTVAKWSPRDLLTWLDVTCGD